ncbi:MAG: hypothetical protein KAR05_02355 [Candidatus Omnitrophica bacterium]|nr:hypothetical protein [Candidatus Omnitrophota bacterium]MCK5607115.1 hypothetical protein [Candidatus Pacearchaeota archaeon]
MKKQNEEIKLTPRWCEGKDVLRGFVILHKNVTHPRGLRHLNYIQLYCVETKKKIYCRIYGPGSRKYREDNQSIVEKSVYLNAYYQQQLQLDDKKIGKNEYAFIINGINPFKYFLYAFLHHPEDSIRVSAFLGIVSLVVSLTSIIISFLISGKIIIGIVSAVIAIGMILWFLIEYYKKP